ncbi:MAG: LacI family DNA-binding transcriptional regulator [Actinomycetota bacterium]
MPQSTIHDVARASGVSHQTVSNAINAPHLLKETTLSRVQEAMRELGYRPHASARRLRTRTSSTIGIRMLPYGADGVYYHVYDRLLHELTIRAERRGLRIMIFTAADHEAEIEQYRLLYDGSDVDAFILLNTIADDPRTAWLHNKEVPFVTFGRPWSATGTARTDHPWVDTDGANGLSQSTMHLIRRGLRSIVLLGQVTDSPTGADRKSGWERAMHEGFGSTPADLTTQFIEVAEDVPRARAAVQRLIDDNNGTPPFDAIACLTDSTALGAMMAVREAGYPHLPVTGFDNTPVARAVGLTSVDQRLDEVAATVLELLMGASGRRVLPYGSGSDDTHHRLITPTLVVRRSSHLAPVDDDQPAAAAGTPPRKDQ